MDGSGAWFEEGTWLRRSMERMVMIVLGSWFSSGIPGMRPAWTMEVFAPMEEMGPRFMIRGQEVWYVICCGGRVAARARSVVWPCLRVTVLAARIFWCEGAWWSL